MDGADYTVSNSRGKWFLKGRGKYWGIPTGILLGSLLLGFSGCVTVGPDYVSPLLPVSKDWHGELKQGLTAKEKDPQALAVWWTQFNDPVLTSLIERAAAGNLDLKKAQARVREARARRSLARSELFPTLDALAGGSKVRSSEETGTGTTTDLFNLSFDAGWELDIFGGHRRSSEAASASLQASQESRRDVLVSLLAEVALNYIEVRTFQARMATAELNLESQTETYQLTLWRYEAGLIDQLAVQQARFTLESIRSQIPGLRQGLEESMNHIAVLLGESPGRVHKELENPRPVPVTPLEVAVGTPIEVLRQRPDLRRAERELAAQTARIGVAVSDLYPKFKLSGSIGLEALSLDNLFTAGSRKMVGALGISWPIFRAGAIRQNIEIQSALQEQALVAYEDALLKALEEVENALVAYSEEHLRRKSLLETTRAAQRVVELTQDKYQAGLTDFSEVLEALRTLWSFQDQLARSEGTVSINLVRLNKALGGGWISPEEYNKNGREQGEKK